MHASRALGRPRSNARRAAAIAIAVRSEHNCREGPGPLSYTQRPKDEVWTLRPVCCMMTNDSQSDQSKHPGIVVAAPDNEQEAMPLTWAEEPEGTATLNIRELAVG